MFTYLVEDDDPHERLVECGHCRKRGKQAKQRWIESLGDLERYTGYGSDSDAGPAPGLRYGAIVNLAQALQLIEKGRANSIGVKWEHVETSLRHAGGYVVAWRRLMDDQGDRATAPDDLDARTRIGLCIRILTHADSALQLRLVEAQLRQMWQEGRDGLS